MASGSIDDENVESREANAINKAEQKICVFRLTT